MKSLLPRRNATAGSNGEDYLQIWKVAGIILNKQSRTAGTGWFSRLGVGRGANNPST
jgi:hypothetical protein